MAKIVQRDYSLKLDTYSKLLSIPNPKDGMEVIVVDAIGDTRTLGGTVVYKYMMDFIGTVDQWMIISQSNEETVSTIEEQLVLVGGQLTLANTPNNNVLIEVYAKWNENGNDFVEDVAYSISGKTVSISSYYDGKTIVIKYLKNTSGKLYQLGYSEGGVSSFLDLADKPSTIAGYGITDAFNKTEVESLLVSLALDNKVDLATETTRATTAEADLQTQISNLTVVALVTSVTKFADISVVSLPTPTVKLLIWQGGEPGHN